MSSPSEETLFHDARALRGEARGAFLDRACSGDAALRARVEALLLADDAATGFLEPADQDDDLPLERAGDAIGRYRLLDRLGEGGFGTVWRAEQREPLARVVALKVIKLGMDTKQVIARFDAERRALAMMDHPNIARVFDAGATDSGRPYFVMEHIEGLPILEHCRLMRLGLRERLGLFVQACRAIHHAHQKGVIHRDIKPSNILVSLRDAEPIVKVIDFGIAKAVGAELTEMTLVTAHRQIVGTPAYMSPEQASLSGADIDTRSDVYSLGVLLYELLTGATPFDLRDVSGRSLPDMLRMIREQEPPRPSTRLSKTGAASPPIADDPRRLRQMLRGDLDWIVMKCLEKHPDRRYDSASSLAADVERHLRDEPVLAGPPGVAYRARKFARRHRASVFVAGAVLSLVLLGLAGTTFGLVRAERERQEAEAARVRAQAAEAVALARADELRSVVDFQAEQISGIDTARMGASIRGLLRDEPALRDAETDALAGVNFTNIALRTLDENIFSRAETAIASRFAPESLVRARLLETVATTSHGLGLLERALPMQREAGAIMRAALGSEHADTLRAENTLGRMLMEQGRLDEAEPILHATHDAIARTLGTDDALAFDAQNNLARLLQLRGRLSDAEALFRSCLEGRARALGDDHPDTITARGNLGFNLQEQGRFDEAEPIQRQVLAARLRLQGEEHPRTITAMSNLGFVLRAQGRTDEAERVYRETLDLRRRVQGDLHPDTLIAMNNYGFLLFATGRPGEAMPYFRETFDGNRRVLGLAHQQTLRALNNLGMALNAGGEHAEALALLCEGESHARRVWSGPNERILGIYLVKLADAFAGVRSFDDAEGLYLEAYPMLAQGLGASHARTRECAQGLADLYEAWHAASPGEGHDQRIAHWRELAQARPAQPAQ